MKALMYQKRAIVTSEVYPFTSEVFILVDTDKNTPFEIVADLENQQSDYNVTAIFLDDGTMFYSSVYWNKEAIEKQQQIYGMIV